MAQEGRSKSPSLPGSFFEIDELDSHWDEDEPSLDEPGVEAEPSSNVQAVSERTAPDDPELEIGFDAGLPLIHPDDELSLPLEPAPDPPLELALEPPLEDAPPPKSAAYDAEPPPSSHSRPDPAASTRSTAPADPLLADVRDRYAMGDYSGALVVAEGILADDPNHVQAQRYAENCRQVLEQMYCAKLGSLHQRPEVSVSGDQLRWLSLDHRAGFLLSLIDGSSSVEELLDISGMPRFEALRTLCDLLEQNVITLAGA
jgi:hypothetical protein